MIVHAWLWLAGVAVATCSAEELGRYQAAQPHMGTQYIILLYAPSQEAANLAFDAGFARIAELDRMLSDYRSDSELNRLSRRAPTPSPVPISPDVTRVLVEAQAIAEASRGAFDVTIGPLTKLWRRARRRHRLPPPDRLQAALAAVGYRHLEVDPEARTAMLKRPDMRLDLGGIAKGYAIDQALQAVRRTGIDRVLINASGDMAAAAPPPGVTGWRVAIAELDPQAPPRWTGRLAHRALATSGDAFQFVEIEGQRYSHIVDPRTGLGLPHRSSVSVLADRCSRADALASAASVLGPAQGLEFVRQQPDAEALIVHEVDDRILVRTTAGFQQWLCSVQ